MISKSGVHLSTGPSVQQQQHEEDQMDCGAATPDPSDHAALSKVHRWGQTDRSETGLWGREPNVQVFFLFFKFSCVIRRHSKERRI